MLCGICTASFYLVSNDYFLIFFLLPRITL